MKNDRVTERICNKTKDIFDKVNNRACSTAISYDVKRKEGSPRVWHGVHLRTRQWCLALNASARRWLREGTAP